MKRSSSALEHTVQEKKHTLITDGTSIVTR